MLDDVVLPTEALPSVASFARMTQRYTRYSTNWLRQRLGWCGKRTDEQTRDIDMESPKVVRCIGMRSPSVTVPRFCFCPEVDGAETPG
ncbi:hypothetical protein J2S03_000331 [Alicyclobacillus cycloheptanicus]|uniref:Uncharacterized protein n=1 Tax=Alicyclobacillus cycloheptanicus TaxID=1457 RepID=A0ABT9XE07_9BACL|nr:hypothetical protein [Alicyclobacillus cycloheptanicus]